MNRRTKSQLRVSAAAIKTPRTAATAAVSKRHENRTDTRLTSSGKVSGSVQGDADCWSKGTTGSRPRRRANRNANAPFTQRKTVEPRKTAKKRATLVPKVVQKTSRYPTVANHNQSTKKSLVRLRAIRQATITTLATMMRLHRILHLHLGSSGAIERDYFGRLERFESWSTCGGAPL